MKKCLSFNYIVTGVLALMILHGGLLSAKENTRSACYPIPLDVEGQTIATQFFVCAGVQDINAPASKALQAIKKPSPEGALNDLLLSVRNNSLADFKRISAGKEEKNLQFQFQTYRTLLASIKDPFLIKRFDLDGLHYFVIRVDDKKNPFVPVIITKKGDEYLQTFESLGDPICQNISSVVRASLKSPGKFREVANPRFNTELPLVPEAWEKNDSPILFRFVGYSTEYPMFSEQARRYKYPHRMKSLLAFDEELYSTVSPTTVERHVELFGPESKVRQKKFLDKLAAEGRLEQYQKLQQQARNVRYVLDSDNLFVLFISDGDPSGNWQYDIVYKMPNGELKRVNYAVGGPFDLLLQSDNLQNKLKQVAASQETICQDGPCEEGVKK